MAELRPSASILEDIAPANRGSGDLPRRERLIIELARDGDRVAFDAIVETRLGQTFRTALAILGSEHDARDAVQEAFIKAWRELPRLRRLDRFDAWFSRIVVNTCRTALRSRGRRQVREIRVDEGSTLPSRAPRLEDRVGDLEARERAFERLSADERAILALHHLEHRSLAELADALGVPEGTVKSRLHAARRSFERALEVTSR